MSWGGLEIVEYDDHSLNNIQNSNTKMSSADYLVAFSGQTEHYCVGIVDMVNSTKIAATLGNGKITGYYQILNSMSRILSRFGGFVIKNVGDSSLLFSRILKAKKKVWIHVVS